MTDYLSYKFEDNEQFISTFDEVPLWSAAFGIFLLQHLELKPAISVIDIGSGAGFPLMELAGRLGASSKLYGLDPWANANTRARQKIINYGLKNVEIIESSAEKMPFRDNSIDLIVSNLGINNFDNPDAVFLECHRVLKYGGKLALTTNLNGHWTEFYMIFEAIADELNMQELLRKLKESQEHRGTTMSLAKLFSDNGLTVIRQFESSFVMKFMDGSAFLNHYFVKLGWLTSWRNLIAEEDQPKVFELLEHRLNDTAKNNGHLSLTVPMAYMEGIKQQ